MTRPQTRLDAGHARGARPLDRGLDLRAGAVILVLGIVRETHSFAKAGGTGVG